MRDSWLKRTADTAIASGSMRETIQRLQPCSAVKGALWREEGRIVLMTTAADEQAAMTTMLRRRPSSSLLNSPLR